MFRGDLTFLRILRFVVLLVPLVAALILDQLPWWPSGLLSFTAGLMISLAPFYRTTKEPWSSLVLIAEVVLGVFIAFAVSGLGVFAAFVIASDIGFGSWPGGVLAIIDVLLGITASFSAVGHPAMAMSRQIVENLSLGLVFVLAMWGNTQGTRQMIALRTAYGALKRARLQEQELIKLKERERIAQNLHDVLGHSLTLIVLKAELITEHLKRHHWTAVTEETGSLVMVARRSLNEVRTVVESIPAFSPVKEMVEELNRAQIKTEVDWNPPDSDPELRRDWELIIREGITNILRHAKATRATIKLGPDGPGWFLAIEDDGGGMNNQRKGYGICGMKARAAKWNGTMKIVSAPNQGTCIYVQGECQAVFREGGGDDDPSYCG